MGLTLTLAKLSSRLKRIEITGGKLREINPAGSIVKGDKGFIDTIFDFGKRLVGFISAAIPAVRGFAVNCWNWLVSTGTSIANFNWNASDSEIEGWMKSNNIALAGTWGRAIIGELGGSIAAIALGVGISMVVPVIGGPTLAKIVAGDVIREKAGDVINAFCSAIVQTFQTMAVNTGLSGYINSRKFLRNIPAFKNWGVEGSKPWSIAGKIEEAIEKIPNEYLKSFVTQGTDQFFETFIEAGYIVANSIDAQWELHKANANNILGKEATLEVYPDPEIKEEKLLLKGNRNMLKGQLTGMLAQAQMVKNKDIGQLIGMPANERVKANPMKRQLVIILYSKAKPPFYDRATRKRAKEVQVSIPDYKPGITWQQIKDAAKGYTWGKYHGIAELDNGRKLDLWAGSETEATEKLRDFAKLTTADVLSIRVVEQKDLKNIRMKREPAKVYPVYVSFLVRKKSVTGQGRSTLTGDFTETRERWDLWRDREPADYKTP
jgi:hypothetical protein